MAASITDSIVKSKGRINYIEPNDFPEYVEKQKYNITDPNMHLDNISWNPEDLQYSVDLQVIIGDRYNENSAVKTKMYGAGTWVSFMEGSTFTSENKEEVKYLTDAYTEISFQEFSNNGISQKESLGIDSIEINFDSHFFPLVTMKFTDVRAAALFGPSEYEYLQKERARAISNDKKLSEEEKEKQISSLEKTSGSFFKSLFRFPYPRFMLSIMGFYGDKVTFQLAVNDFKTNFNSQNGNFDVTVSFIGYMYGLYTDIPMSIVMLAPYFYSDYWKNKKKSGEFTYCDDGKRGNPILTFIEFLEKYHKMYQDINIGENSNKIKEYKYICNQKTSLNNILSAYDRFEGQFLVNRNPNTVEIYNPKKENINDLENVILYSFSSKELNLDYTLYENLTNLIKEYNTNYSTNSDSLKLNSEFEKYANKSIVDLVYNFNKEILDGVKLQTGKKEVNGVYTTTYNRSTFKKELLNKIQAIEKDILQIKNDSDSIMNEIMQTSLTFKPTIENIYRMIFAHIETFISSFDRDIVKTISDKKAERTCIKLGLTEENSDIPYGTKRGDTFVPPFPLCKEKGGEVRYPGTFFEIPELNTIDEVVYVDKIVNGIEKFTDDAKKALEKIRAMEEDSKYIPYKMVTVTDIFYNGKNPYKVLRDKLLEAQNDDEKTRLIEYFFYSRLITNYISRNYRNTSVLDTLNGTNIANIKDDLEKEFNNFTEAGIIINDNIKNNLKKLKLDNSLIAKQYSYYEEIDNSNKIKNISTYFSTNPFENENERKTDGNRVFVLNGYDKQIKKLTDDGINIEESNSRRYIEKSPSNVNLCYILPKEYKRNEVGFYKNFINNKDIKDKQTFFGLYNGKKTDFNAGFLQIGPLTNKSTSAINPYLGDGSTGSTIMEGITDNKFRGFLFLGSICNYFGDFDKIVRTTEPQGGKVAGRISSKKKDEKKDAAIIKMPKLLFLYYGACLYYRKKGFTNPLNGQPVPKVEEGPKQFYNSFTSQRNLFLDEDKNGYKKIFVFSGNTGYIDYLIRQFENWSTDTNGFLEIDNKLRNTPSVKSLKTIKGDEPEHNNDITFVDWDENSPQELLIKELLCEDIYLFYEPSGTRTIRKEEAEELLREKFSQIKTEEDINEEQRKELEKNETNKSEYKKALYYTLKTLYDKWLTSYKLDGSEEKHPFRLHDPNEDYNSRNERFHPINNNGDGGKNNTEFNNFIFVDSFYRDISNKFLVNPTIVCEVIKGYIEGNVVRAQTSVFEFMNEIAEKNNLLFVSLPVYNNLYSREGLLKIFTPNRRLTELGYKGSNDQITIPGNTYMLMYTGEASSKLNLGDECGYEGDGIDIQDIFELPESKVPADLNEIFKVGEEYKNEENTDYNIPAFGVTYARQNQMYFKNVTVNMDNPKVTDYSIANLIQISYGGKHGDLDSYNVGVGQDIYSIYSNRSYTCTVEMLGCLNIMPMMYFQLNNIPMFRGVYIIINVSHSVVPGNVTTRFTGVRVSKNHIGEVKIIFDYQRLIEKMDSTGDDLILTQPNSVSCDNYDLDIQIGSFFKLSNFITSPTAKRKGICNLPTNGVDPSDMGEGPEVIEKRYKEFTEVILDPLQKAWINKTGNGFIIESGYRCTTLNNAIYEEKGAEKANNNSPHLAAYAVDLLPKELNKRNEFKAFVYNWLKSNLEEYEENLAKIESLGFGSLIDGEDFDKKYELFFHKKPFKFDQFIDETNGNPEISGWVHLGYRKKNGTYRDSKSDKKFAYTVNGGKYIYNIDENWVNAHYKKYI